MKRVLLALSLVACDASRAPDPADADASARLDAGKSRGDAGAPVLSRAVADARCPPARRLGLVELSASEDNALLLRANLHDGPPPWVGTPARRDGPCELFLRGARCEECEIDEACSFGGRCVRRPVLLDAVRVLARTASSSAELTGGGSSYASIVLPDEPVSLRVEGDTWIVEADARSIPGALEGAVRRLTGAEEAPSAMDVSWDVPADPATVYSLTNINHHAGRGADFTECAVGAEAGRLHIDGALLRPLAVATGLEFQAIEHVRFAAAEVREGCVELRWTREARWVR